MYILDTYVIPLPWGHHATMPKKETRRKKKGLGQKVKPSRPTQAIDVRIGKKTTENKRKNKRNRDQVPNPGN